MAKKIAIVGRPGVGKSTLAKKLADELGLPIVATDDFIGEVDFKDTANHGINAVRDMEGYVVEGVQVARMLKYGQNEGTWKPDKVYVVEANNRLQDQHRGLASLNREPIVKYLRDNPDIEVEIVTNDFNLPPLTNG